MRSLRFVKSILFSICLLAEFNDAAVAVIRLIIFEAI